MRKIAFLVVAVLVSCFMLGNNLSSTTVSAQKQNGAGKNVSTAQNSPNSDAEMARTIKKLADRSPGSSTQRQTPSGAVELDLNGGSENVVLGRIDDDGSIGAACVTSLGEANAFFGRDLETGRSVPKTKFTKPTEAELAAAHGMSQDEFEFYKRLIADAANRPSSANIVIINNDGPGEGFNDASPAFAVGEGGNNGTTVGQQRLNLFQFAASIWGAYLDSNVPIEVRSQFDPQTCTTSGAVLGSAGSISLFRDFTNAPFTGTWYHGALANKLSNADLSANPDINATFNSQIDTGCLAAGSRWYYGLDNATPSLRINLLITLLHEMGHGLGFSTPTNGSTGNFNSGFPGAWDHFLFDNNTGLFWYQETAAQRQASAIANGALRWDGPNLRNAALTYLTNGADSAGRVRVYTPTTFQGGSSVSHFDTVSTPNLLMEPAINIGLPTSLDLTRQVMRDIGWYRDQNGDLVADTITGVTLDGAATIGATRTIRWSNGGGFNRNVTIELSTDGGATFNTPLAVDVANTGTFNFTVPNLPTSNALIRVREENFLAPLGTSAAFAISAPVATANISGHVFTKGGSGVPFAEVLVLDVNDNILFRTTTNAFGQYFLNNIPVGSYNFLASKKRFRFSPITVNLTGDIPNLDFVSTN
jgi:Carboxypeptidase regulatory-like domain